MAVTASSVTLATLVIDLVVIIIEIASTTLVVAI